MTNEHLLGNLRAIEAVVYIYGKESIFEPIDTFYPHCMFPEGVQSLDTLENLVCRARVPYSTLTRAVFASITVYSYPYDRMAPPPPSLSIRVSDMPSVNLTQYQLGKFVESSTFVPGTVLKTLLISIALVFVFLVLVMAMWITREQQQGLFLDTSESRESNSVEEEAQS